MENRLVVINSIFEDTGDAMEKMDRKPRKGIGKFIREEHRLKKLKEKRKVKKNKYTEELMPEREGLPWESYYANREKKQ